MCVSLHVFGAEADAAGEESDQRPPQGGPRGASHSCVDMWGRGEAQPALPKAGLDSARVGSRQWGLPADWGLQEALDGRGSQDRSVRSRWPSKCPDSRACGFAGGLAMGRK